MGIAHENDAGNVGNRSSKTRFQRDSLPAGIIDRQLRLYAQDMAEQIEILGQARRLVDAIAPAPVCGGCVAERFDDAPDNEVQMSLSELAATRGYARENDTCGMCGTHGHVIRKR